MSDLRELEDSQWDKFFNWVEKHPRFAVFAIITFAGFVVLAKAYAFGPAL